MNLTGKKFGRLTAISFENDKWNCECDCKNTLKVRRNSLISGNTKSCGCLKKDNLIARAHKLSDAKRKFTPYISSARKVWKNTYYYRDNNCIEFDDFLKISQQDCFYCGSPPNTTYNYFLTKSSRGSKNAKQKGIFIYNGMDRVDSSKSHTIDNIVPACIICNRAKNDRSIKDFLYWVSQLKIQIFQPININIISLPANSSLLTSIKCVFYNHKNDTNLTIEEYYSISQMNCFYCNEPPSNILNKAKNDKKSSVKAKLNGNYIYNGIDRVDINFPHNKNNIVACCYWCNFTKNTLSIIDFQNWIEKIQNFQKQKPGV